MSAIRSSNSRRNLRSHTSLPYARPTQKTSSWGDVFNKLKFNAIKLFTASDSDAEQEQGGLSESEPEDGDEERGNIYCPPPNKYQNNNNNNNPAAESLRRRGEEIHRQNAELPQNITDAQTNASPERPGESPPSSFASKSSHSAEDITTADPMEVLRDLVARKNAGEKLSQLETLGLITLLNKSVYDEQREPFRFSKSPSATPTRDTNPAQSSLTPNTSTASNLSNLTNGSSSNTPVRMLTRNPNGNLRWMGAGSAKTGRNRYSSPGFGTSRPPRIRLVVPPPPTPASRSEAKKRRVGESASASFSQPAGPSTASASAPTSATSGPSASANGSSPSTGNAAPRTNGTTSNPTTPPRVRTTALPAKATAPANPSPLRQTWRQAESPSPPRSSSSPTASGRQTRAATLLTEIIDKNTPAAMADFFNPYQAASPVPIAPSMKKKPAKRQRKPAAKVVPPPEEEVVQLTAQQMIEATVPKGSTRSRPPPELQKKREVKPAANNPFDAFLANAPFKSPEPSTPPPISNVVNGDSPPNANGKRPPNVSVEEVEDEDLPSPKKQKRDVPSKPTIILEEIEDVNMIPLNVKVTKPSEIIEPDEAGTGTSNSNKGIGINGRSSFAPPPHPVAAPTAPTFPTTSAPRSAFGLKPTIPKAPSKLRYSMKPGEGDDDDEMVEETRPSPPAPAPAPAPAATTSFFTPPPSIPSFASASSSKPVPVPAPTSTPMPNFFASAGTKSASSSSKTKEEVRASVTAMPVTALPTYSFDIPTSSPGAGPGPSSQKARAAALAVPESSLPTFDLTRPAKTPSNGFAGFGSGSSSGGSSAPKVNGFDWSAAGLKPPTGAGWSCSVCMINNPGTATKCLSCEEPKPAAKPSTPSSTPSTSGGFNWAAAGVKPPTVGWKCPTCMLDNKDTASKCVACDEAKPGAVAKPAVTGFDWAAAGMKPPSSAAGGDEWTCSTCVCKNPASAKEKCTVCETPR